MTVYVDQIINYPGKGQWCHMMTDGPIDELHMMANKIGLKRAWFQNHPRHPHYDLRPNKRAEAISAGAKPVTGRELVSIMKPIWDKSGEKI